MSHGDSWSASERLKRTCRKRESRQRGVASRSVPDTRREQAGKELESDPRGTSLGEVLSCRVFDLGKGAQKPEILVESDELGGRCLETRSGSSKSWPTPIRRKSPMMPEGSET